MSDVAFATTTAPEILAGKVRLREARAVTVGLGHVGLPLAVEFARAGSSIIRINISEGKARWVNDPS